MRGKILFHRIERASTVYIRTERERRVGNVVRHWMAKEREKRKSSIHNREHYSLSEFFQILFLFLSFFFSFIAPFWKAAEWGEKCEMWMVGWGWKTENVPFAGFIHKWWQRNIMNFLKFNNTCFTYFLASASRWNTMLNLRIYKRINQGMET